MDSDQILMTREGYEKIVKEHEHLVSVRRQEVAQRIREAISYGDISENAEYDSAKNEQAELESRILRLEHMMRTGRVIKDEDLTCDHVNLGLCVQVQDCQTKESYEYEIVGAAEADPFTGKISNLSPIGRALLGKTIGERVSIQTEMGVLSLEVLQISKL